jgi:tripartite-type tricarboxylate transporter receptor subunit TctC
MSTLVTRRGVISLSAALLANSRVVAAEYPDRTITLIVPYSAGGGTDTAARLIAPPLADVLKQSVVVVNKPGAGSIIGAEYVAHAAPDGYTLLFNPSDGMVMDPAIYQNLPYNSVEDFAPVTDVVSYPLFVVVKGDSPIKSLRDLVDYAKAHPDQATYASASSVFWLATELFAQQAGITLTRVPYTGAGDMVMAVVSGQVLFSIPSPPPVIGQARSGNIRILATTAPQRLTNFPDVPTMAEAGVPGVSVTDWSGIWAPVGAPAAVIATLNGAVRKALASPELRARAAQLNLTIAGDTPDGVKQKMASELKLWKGVAQKANISMKL